MLFLIRKEQYAAIADADLVRRVKQMVIEDREIEGEPLPAGGGPEIEARIRHGMEVARAYGFETERDLTTFVLHMITINPAFHHQPAIHAVLMDASIPTEEKLEALLSDVSDEDWDAAEAMTDPETYWREARASSNEEQS